MFIQKKYDYTGSKENTRVVSNADETRFTALKGSRDAAYSVTWTIHAPIKDTYIMLPACAYDGNRFEAVERKYPPMFLEEEFSVNPPVRMTQVPRLAPEGDSMMEVTTGDMAAPCVCVLNRAKKEAFMLFFTQGDHGLNHGVTLEQDGDLLHISLRAPAKRSLVYRWRRGVPSLAPLPEADAPLSVRKGTQTVISHRAFSFPCESTEELYREFFEKRALLYRSEAHACLPFSAFWDMTEAQHNKDRYDEETGHYLLDTVERARNNKFTQWQAGWVGGGMSTLPMITDGSELSCSRAVKTLEFAAKYQSKAGFYYGIVHNGKVYHDCFGKFEEKYNLLLIRKHADLTYFMFKQIIALEKRGVSVPESVRKSAVSAADALVRLFERYDQLGQFVNAETGEIVVGGSTSGALTPAALAAAYKVTGNAEYLEAARKTARFFHRTATVPGVTTGGPGEILQCPDSESAAALLESYTVLSEQDGTGEWLKMACDAAHQMASWVVPYDYEFPKDSRFGKRGVKAAGSVWANVQNKHSAPGMCTLSPVSYLKLYRATGNENYLRIMSEIARFMPQTASTPENPMYTTKGEMMLPGEICERVNTSDWEGTHNVGDSIFGSASWPEVSLMLTWSEVPGVYAVPVRGVICVSDHVSAWLDGETIVIDNPTVYPARVKVMIEKEEDLSSPLGLYWQEKFRIVEIPAGGQTAISPQSK